MTTTHKLGPREQRQDSTTWVRDLQTGDVICTFYGRKHAFDAVHDAIGKGTAFAWTSIKRGEYEGTEYITADGEPVAWIDEPPHTYTTDDIVDALSPIQEAAE